MVKKWFYRFINPRTRLIVSFCNLRKPRESGLMCFDLRHHAHTWIELGHDLGAVVTTSVGICTDENYIYHVFGASNQTYISVLLKDKLIPIVCQPLELVHDPHSICVLNQELYIVSTRTDEVIKYQFRDSQLTNPCVVWQASNNGKDTHHLNSISVIKDEIWVSGFGPKKGERWSTADDGYIYSITGDQIIKTGIYHPHTITKQDDTVYYCDSSRATFCSLDSDVNISLNGYTRGIAFKDSQNVFVASSKGRKISKSTGIVNNPADPGDVWGQCEIAVIDLRRKSSKHLVDLSAYGDEIYDLACIE